MSYRKNKLTWTSDNEKTTIEVTRLNDDPDHRTRIYIRHNYGNYDFDGTSRRNVGEHVIYSKSDRLSVGMKRGKEYFRVYF